MEDKRSSITSCDLPSAHWWHGNRPWLSGLLPKGVCGFHALLFETALSTAGLEWDWAMAEMSKVEQREKQTLFKLNSQSWPSPSQIACPKKWSQHKAGQSSRGVWTMLSDTWCDSWGCPMHSQELDLIYVSPFQLRIFYGSVITVSFKRKNSDTPGWKFPCYMGWSHSVSLSQTSDIQLLEMLITLCCKA